MAYCVSGTCSKAEVGKIYLGFNLENPKEGNHLEDCVWD
jgi:hypothetical protein